MVKKAVIPAAGFGTRFLPLTKAMPKEMVPIIDRPAIEYVVKEVREAGVDTFIIVVSRGKGSIEDYFDRNAELEAFLERKGKDELLKTVVEPCGLGSFIFVRQEFPRGLGHAVLCARGAVGDESFAIVLPDDILVSEKPPILALSEAMERWGAGCGILLQRVSWDEVSRYGIVEAEELGDGVFEIKGLVEKPERKNAPSNLAIVGRYIVPPAVFSILGGLPEGRGGEIQLTDALSELLKSTRMVGVVFDGERFDVGTPEGFLKANIEFAKSMGLLDRD